MKYLISFIFLILFGIFISCTSPNESAVNESPSVTITANNSVLSIGDTLKLTLYIEDHTLKSGTVDFKDSSVIVFNNLDSVLDTTLFHVFRTVGSHSILISFSDGNSSTIKHFDVTVSNDYPELTIIPNKTTISLGDTLKLKLYAFDFTLSNGSVDFGDGNLIMFSNLNHVVDTTIEHVYNSMGTYSVSATFSDGYISKSTSVNVEVSHFFAFSFAVGMKWRFLYDYSYTDAVVGEIKEQSGIHEWKIISCNATNMDTTFIVEQTRNDTMHFIHVGFFDTTYSVKDTFYLTIVVSVNTVQFSWYNGIDIIPNYFYANSNLFTHYWYTYDDNGPFYYYYSFQAGGYVFMSEKLSLIDFYKP